jgi:hypothetical protein
MSSDTRFLGGALAGVVLAAVLASAAHGAPARVHGSGTGAVAPSGLAAEVLRSAQDYRSWTRFSRYAAPVLSKAHTGNHVVVWFNAAAAPGTRPDAPEYPEGSILVKENRVTPDGPPGSLSIMAKRSGRWFWISATPDGKVFTADGAPLAGELDRCAGCHAEADRDMVFSR